MRTIDLVLNTLTYIAAFILTYLSIYLVLIYLKNRETVLNYKGKRVWEPKVSIIVPAYNEEKLIGRCIESLLNLDYPKEKLEIIVVDDCSTDRTYEVAKRYEPKGVRVVRTPANGGCAAKTKNYGLRFATGEVIGFLDSDSFVEPDTLRKMLPYFEEGVGAVTPAVRIWEPKNWIEKMQYIEYEVILFLRRVWMSVESVYVTPGPFSLFTREAIESVGGFDENSLTEDHEIALNIQAKGYLIRSTIDATVFTVPPNTIISWIKQRTRWLRGGVYNRIKHKYLLNIFKYGEFGFVAITFDVALLFPISLMLIGPPLRLIFNDHWTDRLGLLSIFYSMDALTVLGVAMSIFSIGWFYHIWSYMKNYAPRYKVEWWVWILYLLAYSSLSGYVWLFVLWKEITRASNTWDTR